MIKSATHSAPKGALISIVAILLLSGLLRLGGVGLAVANESEEFDVSQQEMGKNHDNLAPDLNALLEMIATRTAALDAKEAKLQEKEYALNAARVLIDQNLVKLEAAEKRLGATIANVDGASEDDLERLTSVYESMKPKVASQLFEQMDAEFAAGFLGRMAPQAAANIMSGLSSETGYAISVVLAGRNATAPKN